LSKKHKDFARAKWLRDDPAGYAAQQRRAADFAPQGRRKAVAVAAAPSLLSYGSDGMLYGIDSDEGRDPGRVPAAPAAQTGTIV